MEKRDTTNGTLILKTSGREITDAKLSILRNILRTQLERYAAIYLVFGGGEQITALCKEKGIATGIRKNQERDTTAEIMNRAVVPALHDISETIRRNLSPLPLSFYESDDISCHHDDEKCGAHGGCVHAVHAKQKESIHCIGFVGKDSGSRKLLNVNADLVAEQLAYACLREKQKVELILLTKSSGVMRKDGSIAGRLTNKDLTQIIEGSHNDIDASDGMREKIIHIQNMLVSIDQICITSTEQLSSYFSKGNHIATICTRD